MKKFLAGLGVLALAFGVQVVRAQDQQPQVQDSQNVPQDYQSPSSDAGTQQSTADAPGVARVSYISGNASSQRGDNGEWVALTVNAPLEAGDRISTGQGSRAEVQLNSGFVLRLSENATAKIATLTQNQIQVQVGQGLVNVAVLGGGNSGAEIDTPNVAIHPTAEGEYRILVNSDSESEVTVRRGAADVTTPQGSTQVEAGQMISIEGTDNPEYKTVSAPPRDDWDAWNNDRDNHIQSAQSWRDTNRNYTGAEDLDNNGVWTEVPDYGRVWTPNEPPDWAPYRDGRWVYEPYYGWTWVSYEPWGWAPYHYGRWFVYDGSWAWWPGPVGIYPAYYPVWSPAYVSFFGWGGGGWGFGFGFGFGWGHVGWMPCGPGDWYHPWWGRWGGGYHAVAFDRYNSFHEGFGPLARNNWHQYSNFNEAFRNNRIRNGISSMNGSDFGRGSVPGHQERVSEGTLRQANVGAGRIPMQPNRASYSPSGREANAGTFRHAPPASQRFFSSSRAAGSPALRSGMRSGGTQTATGLRGSGSQPAMGNRGNESRSPITSSRPGFRPFTPPAANGGNRGNFSRGPANQPSRGPANESGRGSFAQPSGRPNSPATRGNSGNWRPFTPPARGSQQPRGGNSGSYNSYNRPSLNMRQPIVRPRGGSSYGNNAPRGSYSAPRQYSAPRAPSAPRSYSAPRGNSAPRSYSAPRGYSAPRSGGGGGFHGGGGSHGGAPHGGGGGGRHH